MEALTIEMFKTDKMTAISADDKSSGGSNYKSVKFAYDGGEVHNDPQLIVEQLLGSVRIRGVA